MPSRTLHFPSPRHLSSLYAGREENLAHAERTLGVKLITREDWLKIEPPTGLSPAAAAPAIAVAASLFTFLDSARSQGMTIRTPDFHRITDGFARGEGDQLRALITSGEFQAGARLPAERDIAKELGVSRRNLIRKVAQLGLVQKPK